MTINDEERTAIVEIIATAAGTDFNNAQFLVESAIRVLDRLASLDSDKAKIKMLAVYFNSIGASMTPVYAARHNIPKAAPPDPTLISAARTHVESADEHFQGHIDPRLENGADFDDVFKDNEVFGDDDDE